MVWTRPDGRTASQLRPVEFQRNFTRFAAGSVLAKCGDTHVLCTVSVKDEVPRWLKDSGQGWLTAEYRMLPGATPDRHKREYMRLSGRTQEIQRLVGRSLRAAVDLNAVGERTFTVDCDVIQADAGTRTTSITGGYVALVDAINALVVQGDLEKSPIKHGVAAVSIGLIEGAGYLDLNYPEDVKASVDLNVVMTEKSEILEVQGTAEEGTMTRQQLNAMLDLADTGIQELIAAQRQALA